MKKKGQIMLLLSSFGFLLAIALFFYLSFTTGTITDFIGSSQLQLLTQAKDAEKAQLYIEQSAKLAAVQSIYDLALNSGCGDYYKFSIWTNQTTDCMPTRGSIRTRLNSVMNKDLNPYLLSYGKTPLGKDNYNIMVQDREKLKILGAAITPLIVSFGKSTLPSCVGGDMQKAAGSVLKECFVYHNTFLNYLQKNNLAQIDPLLIESLSYRESECNPGVDAGGIMQVDDPCRFKNACPTVAIQIDEGTKEFYQKFSAFKDLAAGDAMTLTLFGYNRGTAIAQKAKAYYAGGLSLRDAMFKACTEDFLKSQSTDYKGKTWEESFPLRKAANPKKYEDFDNAIDYYCIATGTSYPYKIFDTYKQACSQIGGQISEVGASGGQYSIKPNFKAELNYNLSEYDDIKTELNEILLEVKDKKCENSDCIKETFANKKFQWSYNCLPEKQRVFYDLIEAYELCTENGICAIPRPETEKTYEIEFTKKNGKIIAKLDDLEYETKLKELAIVNNNLQKINFNELLPREVCDKIKITVTSNSAQVSGECTESKNFGYSYNENILLFISGNGYFFEPVRVTDYAGIIPVTPKSNMLKLCAVSNYRNYFYDDFNKSTKERNALYRFAVFNPQTE